MDFSIVGVIDDWFHLPKVIIFSRNHTQFKVNQMDFKKLPTFYVESALCVNIGRRGHFKEDRNPHSRRIGRRSRFYIIKIAIAMSILYDSQRGSKSDLIWVRI